MEKTDSQKQARQTLLVNLLRWAGFFLMILAGFIFFDVNGLASNAQLTEGGINQILGAMLFVMGLVDVVLIPRVFEALFRLGRK